MKFFFLPLLILVSRVVLHEAALSLILDDVQATIQEDARVLKQVFQFLIEGDTSEFGNNIVCYVQHVKPQPNTDPLIGPFRARLFGNNNNNNSVVYDPDSGFPLNTLIQTFYQIRLCCYSANQGVTPDPPTCRALFITVTQNIPPLISGVSEITVAGDADINEILTTYMVTDQLDQDSLSLSLSSTPKDAASFFNIDYKITGTADLSLAVNGQQIPYGQLTLFINATDGKDSFVKAVQVTIADFNSRPNIRELPQNITLPEDTPKETTIALLNFEDVDGFTARIEPKCTVNPRDESFKFVYDVNRRSIKLTNVTDFPLDFETNNFYNITCVISDGFLDSAGEHLLIFVQNVNEPPVFQKTAQSCQLSESQAGGSFCDVSFRATDPDNDAVVLSLAGNFSEKFALTDNNRRLTFAVDYDLEAVGSPTSVKLTVVATDPLGATGTTLINVAIADVNDNDPVFTTEMTIIPIEYVTSRGVIGALTATDRDLGTNGDLEFSLISISPPDAATHFRLFQNGEIHYLSQFPDTLAGTTALVVAQATDKGTPSRSATSTIALAFGTTTTSTTTTASTTTQTTTTTTTTTTVAPTPAPFDFWSRPENIAMFTILMLLLLLLLLALLWLCLRLCLGSLGRLGGGGAQPGVCASCFGQCCRPGACSGFVESCRDCDCDCDCCRPPRRIQPQIVTSLDYDEDFWNRREHYESGNPYKT
ncbi:hypothetical protein LOTGIDRAFT_171473 [Lottia gigantea]|uniref:Cadherin domain-containing protein n=1 Tax=Lottia gigantea TaxID=225164 RepID=V4CM60_LOTGI|nr:hypothetical protein LOTGIDRAFT_171473 [Lottia gigantea]ESP03385.1 hypothetical protein LOTGIDRAFT_171473 [Lottia gigantea]